MTIYAPVCMYLHNDENNYIYKYVCNTEFLCLRVDKFCIERCLFQSEEAPSVERVHCWRRKIWCHGQSCTYCKKIIRFRWSQFYFHFLMAQVHYFQFVYSRRDVDDVRAFVPMDLPVRKANYLMYNFLRLCKRIIPYDMRMYTIYTYYLGNSGTVGVSQWRSILYEFLTCFLSAITTIEGCFISILIKRDRDRERERKREKKNWKFVYQFDWFSFCSKRFCDQILFERHTNTKSSMDGEWEIIYQKISGAIIM